MTQNVMAALTAKWSIWLKVVPQKLKLRMNFFETFPECSFTKTVSKNTKMIVTMLL